MSDLISLIDELSELAKEKKRLGERYNEVEAEILKQGEAELKDSKEKSISYVGSGSNKVTFTKSESLKVVFPSLLKSVFGVLYGDVVEEKTTYTINADGKKLLTNMWLGNYYSDISVETVIQSLDTDEKTKKVLFKKIKGKDPEKDKKTFMTVAGIEEKEAEQMAYFVSEAIVWKEFMAIVNANKNEQQTFGNEAEYEEYEKERKALINKMLECISSAVMVDEGVKLKVE